MVLWTAKAHSFIGIYLHNNNNKNRKLLFIFLPGLCNTFLRSHRHAAHINTCDIRMFTTFVRKSTTSHIYSAAFIYNVVCAFCENIMSWRKTIRKCFIINFNNRKYRFRFLLPWGRGGYKWKRRKLPNRQMDRPCGRSFEATIRCTKYLVATTTIIWATAAIIMRQGDVELICGWIDRN